MSSIPLEEFEKEFMKNRTSWRYFERILNAKEDSTSNQGKYLESKILLEILKELQYLNK